MPQAKNTVSVMFELTNSLFVVNCSLKMKWKRFCFLKGEILSCSYNQFNVFDTCSVLQVLAKELAVFGIMVKRWYGDIYEIVCDEINNGLKLIPKLTLEHVQLNPYSIMKIHLPHKCLVKVLVIYLVTITWMLHMLQLNFVNSWTCCLTVQMYVASMKATQKRKNIWNPIGK